MKFEYYNQFLKLANKINRKKYRLLGVKNKELLEKLIELDAEYFTHMFILRQDFNSELEWVLNDIPFEKKDLLK